METQVEMQPDKDDMRQPCAADTPVLVPRRTRTRRGKVRLISLDALDARTAAARAARELIAMLSTDLGGDEQLSAGERQLVQRAAMCGAIVADFEARWVAGEPIALNEYLSAVNVQRRVLATLGLRREPRDVTPSLDQVIAEEIAARREAESDE
jgi:hypothetical protein